MFAFSPYEVISFLVDGGVATILTAIAIIDWQTRRIPNTLVLALVALRLVMLVEGLIAEGAGVLEVFIQSVAVSAIFTMGIFVAKAIADHLAHTETLGCGDVKLIAVGCLFLDFDQALAALFASSLVALILATYFRLAQRDRTFPFGPALSFGFLFVYLL